MVTLSACQAPIVPVSSSGEQPVVTVESVVSSEIPLETATAQPSSQSGLKPDAVKIDYAVFPIAEIQLIPKQPFDNTSGPHVKGLPEHIRIAFGEDNGVDYPFVQPVLTIIPVKDYSQMWLDSGFEIVSEHFSAIQTLIGNPPAEPPVARVPVLPLDAAPATIDLVSQFKMLDSDLLHGYRFVAREPQGLNPLINWDLFYFFVGLTNDNHYLVTMMVPVTSSLLLDKMEDVPAAELDLMYSDYNRYMQEKESMLKTMSTSDWSPDIETLDKIIHSLKF
jgi:hypothetical protein